MKRVAAAAVLLAAAAASAQNDPKAVDIGRQMIAAMGGQTAWEHARFFRFDFVVVRNGQPVASFSHWWDRYDGRYRVEGVRPDGARWQAFFNVNTRKGVFLVNGAPAEGEARAKGLEQAYGRFINDTYWLLAPWKIFDPGVHLAYGGQVEDSAGRACDEIALTFDDVGLTPKDRYWMDIDRATHLMTQWKYVLNGSDEPPTLALWKNWTLVGPIRLSDRKELSGKPVEIRFENLRVSETPDDAALRPPD
jgi:hypothetical protein